jgi:hypothetical protein
MVVGTRRQRNRGKKGGDALKKVNKIPIAEFIILGIDFPLLHNIPYTCNVPYYRRKGAPAWFERGIWHDKEEMPSIGKRLLPCNIVNLLI